MRFLWSFSNFFFFVFCRVDFRRPRFFPAPATSVLSICACLWRQLHDRRGKHTSDYVRPGGSLWGTALCHGILLCPPPHVPKVYFHTTVCTANWNSSRFHPWPRLNPLLQKSPCWMEGIHWVSLSFLFFPSLCDEDVSEKVSQMLATCLLVSFQVSSSEILCKPAVGMSFLLIYMLLESFLTLAARMLCDCYVARIMEYALFDSCSVVYC